MFVIGLCSVKVDSERNEISALKRENQSLVESCDSLEKARQRVSHDLGVKEQQVREMCPVLEQTDLTAEIDQLTV